MSKNHKPHAGADTASIPANGYASLDVLTNDSDRDGDTLSLDGILKAPKHGIASILDGSVLYTPDDGWHGRDRLAYQVDDGHGGAAHGRVTITVEPPEGVGGSGHGETFTSAAANERWNATPGHDVFQEHFVDTPTTHLTDLGHDTIKGFGTGDVLDFSLHLDDGRQTLDLSSLDLLNSLDTNRDGVLSAADGGDVHVKGHSITLNLGQDVQGAADDPTVHHFTGEATLKGKTEVTAADLGTSAPWAQQVDHIVHQGSEHVVA